MVVDAFLFYNELDLLEIRLNILDEYVDKFVIVEATKTFTGNPKPLYFANNRERFAKWKDKIVHYVVDELTEEVKAKALASPNTGAKEHFWLREFAQKESMMYALDFCNDHDFVFISDLDEIWNPETLFNNPDGVLDGLKVYRPLQVAYHYFLNNRSNQSIDGWVGTRCTFYQTVKKYGINHVRTEREVQSIPVGKGGWHFSNMGGLDALKDKLSAYSHVEFNTPQITNRLEASIKHNVDFASRGFNLWVDESQLPQYLKDNKQKWIKLFR